MPIQGQYLSGIFGKLIGGAFQIRRLLKFRADDLEIGYLVEMGVGGENPGACAEGAGGDCDVGEREDATFAVELPSELPDIVPDLCGKIGETHHIEEAIEAVLGFERFDPAKDL